MTSTMLKTTFDGLHDEAKEMPADAVIRYVGERRGQIVLWFETNFDLMDYVEGETGKVTRHFAIRQTGHPIPDGATYLGSVPMATLVWHVFEMTAEGANE